MVATPSRSPYFAALRQIAQPVDLSSVAQRVEEAIGDARIVMLGEASHGTSEFYTWRAAISQHLIRERGFRFIAVEGDWPDCQRVHEYTAHGKGKAREALAGYHRFPTWMWGNAETLELVNWLRQFNSTQRLTQRAVGFHGLDVYSLHDSMRLVVQYLERVDPQGAERTRQAYACFEPFGDDPVNYARSLRLVPIDCERDVVRALHDMERLRAIYSRINPDHADPHDAYFDAVMNARVSRDAEAYYRAMLSGGAASWNVRDRHMMQTLRLLLDHAADDARGIVWAHNTHIGDYRATDMLREGYVNLGGLARLELGEDDVRLIGFGTHHGTVMAAEEWGAEPEVMTTPAAVRGSLEDHLHRLGLEPVWLPLRAQTPALRSTLNEIVDHRAIGVVYHPPYERGGNYVPTALADRYDAFIFIDETKAVQPLGITADLREEPEAWPTGL